jgi:nucleoside-diphosphate-sugar epimerase
MRVLITGANGFLGAHLARKLTLAAARVRCLVRRSSDTAQLAGLPVELMYGDVVDPPSLASAVRDCDVVFHLAGIRRASSREAFWKVNAEGTRHLCQALLDHPPTRLVLCSSLAACGPSAADRPHTEEDPLRPLEWYGESKAEAERIATSFAPPLEVSVARPPRILGPGDRENLIFFKLVQRGVRLSIGGGPRPLSMVDVDDAAAFLIELGRRPEAAGEAFFVAAAGTTTLEEIQEQAAQTLKVRTRTLRMAPAVLRGLATAADWVSQISGTRLPLNRKLAAQLLAPAWTCSADKARARLGFEARHTLADSIRRSAEWYRASGWLS